MRASLAFPLLLAASLLLASASARPLLALTPLEQESPCPDEVAQPGIATPTTSAAFPTTAPTSTPTATGSHTTQPLLSEAGQPGALPARTSYPATTGTAPTGTTAPAGSGARAASPAGWRTQAASPTGSRTRSAPPAHSRHGSQRPGSRTRPATTSPTPAPSGTPSPGGDTSGSIPSTSAPVRSPRPSGSVPLSSPSPAVSPPTTSAPTTDSVSGSGMTGSRPSGYPTGSPSGAAGGNTSASAGAGASAGSGGGCPDIQAALDAHNAARVRHGASPLTWSSTLAQHAQGVANTCAMQHSNSPYGENLAMGIKTCAAAVAMWMSEESSYVPGSGFSSGTGHYTQIVWKSTTQVGCGFAACGLVVCQYDPAGNMQGTYGANVS